MVSLNNLLLVILICLWALSCHQEQSERSAISKADKCDAVWYATPSENPRCYQLQEDINDAVGNKDTARIEKDLNSGANVNGGYDQSLPLLEGAAIDGDPSTLDLLIKNGASVNKVRSFGQTALKTAVYNKHLDAVKLLIDKGANVCENTEESAMQYALESGDEEIIALLKAAAKDCK